MSRKVIGYDPCGDKIYEDDTDERKRAMRRRVEPEVVPGHSDSPIPVEIPQPVKVPQDA